MCRRQEKKRVFPSFELPKSWIAERVVVLVVVLSSLSSQNFFVRFFLLLVFSFVRHWELTGKRFFVRKFHSSSFNNVKAQIQHSSHPTPNTASPPELLKCDAILQNKIAKFESFFPFLRSSSCWRSQTRRMNNIFLLRKLNRFEWWITDCWEFEENLEFDMVLSADFRLNAADLRMLSNKWEKFCEEKSRKIAGKEAKFEKT